MIFGAGAQWLEEGGPLATLQHRWAPLLKALVEPPAALSKLRLGLAGPTALGATARQQGMGLPTPPITYPPSKTRGLINNKANKFRETNGFS